MANALNGWCACLILSPLQIWFALALHHMDVAEGLCRQFGCLIKMNHLHAVTTEAETVVDGLEIDEEIDETCIARL